MAGKTGTAQNSRKDHSVFMGFAPVDTPKVAIAVYVENGGFGARFGVPIGSLLMEQYINGKLTKGDEARAASIQKEHISYGFLRPMTHADSLRLDSIKRINAIKDSIKKVEEARIQKEKAQEKALHQKEDEENGEKKQPMDQPIFKSDDEIRIKTETEKEDPERKKEPATDKKG